MAAGKEIPRDDLDDVADRGSTTDQVITVGGVITTADIRVDSDSGLYKAGAAQDYTFGWDGSDAVHTISAGQFVFTGGNVGIGTAAPGELLGLAPDTDVSAEIGRAHVGYMGFADYAGFSHVDQNGTTGYAFLQNASGQTWFNAAAGQPINFNISASKKMKIGSSGGLSIGASFSATDPGAGVTIIEGLVGIGTTAPDAPLEINAATGGGIRLTYNDANGSATDYATLFTDANGGLQIVTVDGDGAAGNIDIAADGVVTVGDGGTTNYLQMSQIGDLSFAGSAGFYPRRISQANAPANGTGATQIDAGELLIWQDSDNTDVWMVFNDATGGVVKIQLA